MPRPFTLIDRPTITSGAFITSRTSSSSSAVKLATSWISSRAEMPTRRPTRAGTFRLAPPSLARRPRAPRPPASPQRPWRPRSATRSFPDVSGARCMMDRATRRLPTAAADAARLARRPSGVARSGHSTATAAPPRQRARQSARSFPGLRGSRGSCFRGRPYALSRTGATPAAALSARRTRRCVPGCKCVAGRVQEVSNGRAAAASADLRLASAWRRRRAQGAALVGSFRHGLRPAAELCAYSRGAVDAAARPVRDGRVTYAWPPIIRSRAPARASWSRAIAPALAAPRGHGAVLRATRM